MSPKVPRPRMGARGLRKVSTGCQTCKIRHKKCDESRPACIRCKSTGRRCDFILPAQPHRNSLHEHAQGEPSSVGSVPAPLRRAGCSSDPVPDIESIQLEFFCLVCAPEYGILFEIPDWESLVLRFAASEPCIYHAALAISALTWNHYSPMPHWYDPATRTRSVAEYSTIQYNIAIRCLEARLGNSAPDRDLTKLAILAAILFMNTEFLRRDWVSSFRDGFLAAHLRHATCLLQDLKRRSGELLDFDGECLEIGVVCIQRQAQQLEEYVMQNR